MSKKILHYLTALSCLAPPLAVSAEEAPKVDKIARGLLMLHAEKLIFAPCRERIYAEIDDVSTDQQLGSALLKLGLAEKKPLYVEFVGQIDAGRLNASAINFASTQARCQSSASIDEKWRGIGQGPRWSLRIGEHTAKLAQEGQTELTFSDVALKLDGDQARLRFNGNISEQWSFKRGLCHGEENNTLFGWQAELKRANGTLRGCAWQGY